jgi:penicillin-binding protein-related factor A (putative recombinase)
MKSKDLEQACIHRLQREEEAGNATMSRYGVQGSFVKGSPAPDFVAMSQSMNCDFASIVAALGEAFRAGKASADSWRPLQSLPDFEGVLAPSGRQFIFDAKLCSAASLDLHISHVAERQLRHLRKRDRFGAICFFLIHFPERALKKTTDPAQTWAFPVSAEHPFWQAFDRGEVKRITRADCEEYAVAVPWNTLPGGRTPRPDILAAVQELLERRTVEAA